MLENRAGSFTPRENFSAVLKNKTNAMGAVVLRDMRTRFFNHGLGFLLVSVWPLAHVLILLAMYKLAGRVVPYGESPYVFFSTGLIPTLAFTYISRFMCLSIILNKPMLSFPAVQVTDIIFGRAFLEVIGGFITLSLIFICLISIGDSPFPTNMEAAFSAYGATILLSIGVGCVASVITMIIPFFATVYALFMILVYLLSGAVFVASSLPQPIIDVISWNPVLHCVEWMRVAYYQGYSQKILDVDYVLKFGVFSLFLGLFLERVLRRVVKES